MRSETKQLWWPGNRQQPLAWLLQLQCMARLWVYIICFPAHCAGVINMSLHYIYSQWKDKLPVSAYEIWEHQSKRLLSCPTSKLTWGHWGSKPQLQYAAVELASHHTACTLPTKPQAAHQPASRLYCFVNTESCSHVLQYQESKTVLKYIFIYLPSIFCGKKHIAIVIVTNLHAEFQCRHFVVSEQLRAEKSHRHTPSQPISHAPSYHNQPAENRSLWSETQLNRTDTE